MREHEAALARRGGRCKQQGARALVQLGDLLDYLRPVARLERRAVDVVEEVAEAFESLALESSHRRGFDLGAPVHSGARKDGGLEPCMMRGHASVPVCCSLMAADESSVR
jgi:hypothetical protein